MPNPTPGVLATGNYSSRTQLAAAVGLLRKRGMGWTAIAKATGTSPRTAERCFEEDKLARELAREQAYQIDRAIAAPPPAAPTPRLTAAIVIYAVGILTLLAVAVFLISRHH